MNKKIKMIELLNMIARGELKNKTKFKVYSSCKDDSDIPYICEYDKTEPGIIWCITSYDSKFNFKIDYMRILNYYVEILEDNTEEIEEKSNFENMGYEIAQAYFEFYKGIAKALTEKRKESEDKQW